MNLVKKLKRQDGVTLIEVLLSITILGIILITFMHFFLQAGKFTNSNQKKTVGVNVARNTLMYMEHQNFLQVREEFKDVLTNENATDHPLTLMICHNQYQYFNKNTPIPSTCKNITVNNTNYHVTISSEHMDDCIVSDDINNKTKCNYYVPLKVKVGWQINEKDYDTSVEGTIKSEDLR